MLRTRNWLTRTFRVTYRVILRSFGLRWRKLSYVNLTRSNPWCSGAHLRKSEMRLCRGTVSHSSVVRDRDIQNFQFSGLESSVTCVGNIFCGRANIRPMHQIRGPWLMQKANMSLKCSSNKWSITRGGTEWQFGQILQGLSQSLSGSVVRVIQWKSKVCSKFFSGKIRYVTTHLLARSHHNSITLLVWVEHVWEPK